MNRLPSNIKENKNVIKDIEEVSSLIKKSKLKFSDIAIPIVAGAVLILLSIFLFIPMVSSALEYQTEIKETDSKMETLKKLENSLNSLDEVKLNDDLVVAKRVIPKLLNVSDFIYYVDTLARNKGLTTKEISAGDTTTGTTDNKNLSVSGPVGYSGSYDSIIEFLDEVQTVSPYIIGVKNIEMSRSSNNVWNISLSVSGYYMPDKTSSIDLYSGFKAYTDYTDVLKIFNEKTEISN